MAMKVFSSSKSKRTQAYKAMAFYGQKMSGSCKLMDFQDCVWLGARRRLPTSQLGREGKLSLLRQKPARRVQYQQASFGAFEGIN